MNDSHLRRNKQIEQTRTSSFRDRVCSVVYDLFLLSKVKFHNKIEQKYFYEA